MTQDTEPIPPPERSAIDREILCPLCDYNLRGLSEPRCPECGYRSTWPELLHQAPPHPYLFEYHSRRNCWSFGKTINETPIPREFWQSVRPTHPVRTRRLVMYWTLIALPVSAIGLTLASVQLGWRYGNAASGRQLLAALNYPWRLAYTVVPVLIIAILWPWLTFASLMVYRTTMRQAHIHWQHVLRCTVYSSDAGLLVAIPIGLVASSLEPYIPWRLIEYSPHLWALYVFMAPSIWLGSVPLIALMGYRLNLAYRIYLNFPDAHRAVLASQFLVLLASVRIWFMFARF